MRTITLITLIPLTLIHVACGENATGPPSPPAGTVDLLDGQVLFRYEERHLPNNDGERVHAEEVIFWTFERGAFVFKREIMSEHTGTLLPTTQWLLYEISGRYWENERIGRRCSYVFEGTSAKFFDYDSQRMEDAKGDIFMVSIVFGDDSVKVESHLYHRASIAELPAVRSGALKW